MEEIIIYEKPTCSKCREAVSMVDESGAAFRRVRYYDEPLTQQKFTELIRKMGITARELLRTNEPLYRELGLAKADLSDTELIALMVKHPDLMQRPILERGDMAILGRPTERVAEFLKQG
jgi:arsenate reductase